MHRPKDLPAALHLAALTLGLAGCVDRGVEARGPTEAPPATLPPAVVEPAPAPEEAVSAEARVVSEHYVAGGGNRTAIVQRNGFVAARFEGMVFAWDAQHRPLATAEVFDHDVYLALRDDLRALAVAGRVGPDWVVDLHTGEALFVPFEPRWKWDIGLQQVAPSGLPAMPWIGVDAYDVVLLDAKLARRGVLPRNRAQERMVELDERVRRLDAMDPRQGDRGGVFNLRLTADGRTAVAFATERDSAPVRLVRWDVEQRRRIGDVPLPRDLDGSAFAVSSTGAFAVVRGWSKAQDRTQLYRVELTPSPGRATLLGDCPHGASLAISSDDATVIAVAHGASAAWSLAEGRPLPQGAAIGGGQSATVTPTSIVVDRPDGLHRLDPRTFAPQGVLGAPGRGIRAALRLEDGTVAIAAESPDSAVYLWSPEQPEGLVEVGPVPHHFGVRSGRLHGLFSEGPCAAARELGGRDEASPQAPRWKLCSPKAVGVGQFGVDPQVVAVDFERDRVALRDGALYVVDGPTGHRTKMAGSEAYERLRLPSFSPGGRYLIAAAIPPQLVPERLAVWETSTGKLMHRLRIGKEFVGYHAGTRDDRRLVAGWGEVLHLFDLTTGEELETQAIPSFIRWLRRDPGTDEIVVRTSSGRQRFDDELNPLEAWSGWRLQRIGDGSRLAFLGSGGRRLATLELTRDGHVVYTPEGAYAFSGAPPDHLYRVEAQRRRATRLTAIAGRHDPAAVRDALAAEP